MMYQSPRIKDAELLRALLDARDQLCDDEVDAFIGMQKSVAMRMLTPRQREWAESVYERLELDAEKGAANLVSSGHVKCTEPTSRTVASILAKVPERFRHPLKPPGKC